MCGFVGSTIITEHFEEALSLINYRGPDASRIVHTKLSGDQNVILGHNRLSFLDLSPEANQPMTFGDHQIVFNGEIYNFSEIRDELLELGWTFSTQSDTEVILLGYIQWQEEILQRLDGMFSFAIINKNDCSIFLARDRFGVKPLYYYADDTNLIFSSEIQCIAKLINLKINHTGVGQFLKFGYFIQPETIYQDVYQVLQGECIKFNLTDGSRQNIIYWSTEDQYELAQNKGRKEKVNYKDLDRLLKWAVAGRMTADVDVGVCLSGGYDSSLCAALAAKSVDYQIETFTIGFDNADRDESLYAAEFAKHINVKNTIEFCTESNSQKILYEVLQKMGEPLADSSIIPTYQVFQSVSKKLKAAISADGGDELFAGYNKYKTLSTIRFMKNFLILLNCIKFILPKKYRNKVSKINRFQNCSTASHYMNISREVFSDDEIRKLVKNVNISKLNPVVRPIGTFMDQLQMHDNLYYQQNSVLVKVDRMSMLNSVEAREPLLQKDLQNFGYNLRHNAKIDWRSQKKPLKNYSKMLFGGDILDRPKRGFGSPVEHWLKGNLINDVRRIVHDKEMSKLLGLDHALIRDNINYYLSTGYDYKKVWHIFILYNWAGFHLAK